MKDLNELSNSNARLTQNRGNSTSYTKFNRFIQQMDLLDLGYSILPFTCYNKRNNEELSLKDYIDSFALPVDETITFSFDPKLDNSRIGSCTHSFKYRLYKMEYIFFLNLKLKGSLMKNFLL